MDSAIMSYYKRVDPVTKKNDLIKASHNGVLLFSNNSEKIEQLKIYLDLLEHKIDAFSQYTFFIEARKGGIDFVYLKEPPFEMVIDIEAECFIENEGVFLVPWSANHYVFTNNEFIEYM